MHDSLPSVSFKRNNLQGNQDVYLVCDAKPYAVSFLIRQEMLNMCSIQLFRSCH